MTTNVPFLIMIISLLEHLGIRKLDCVILQGRSSKLFVIAPLTSKINEYLTERGLVMGINQ